MEPTSPRSVAKTYWAFLSYSRLDKADGARLHARLERYRVPRSLVGQASVDGAIPPRLTPIFRDLDELAAAASLSGSIAQAIDASRYFILLCTPASSGSGHVNEEVAAFLRAAGRDRIRCFVPASVPPEYKTEDLIPASLRTAADGDVPLATDERASGDGSDAFLKLVAGLLGIGLDTLKRRERTRQRRRLAIAALAVLLAGLSGFLVLRRFNDAAQQARAQANSAQRTAALAASANAVERAMAHESKGETESSLAWLARAVRLDPANPAATSALVSLLLNRHWPAQHFGGSIASAKVSGDGKTLVALTDSGAAQVWELMAGRRITVDGFDGRVDHVAVSHDGTRVAIGRGSQLVIANVTSGETQTVDRDDQATTCGLEFTGADLWSLSSSGRLERLRDGAWARIDTTEARGRCPSSWAVTANGAAVAADDDLRILDTTTTPATIKRIPEGAYASTLRFTPDGEFLAVGARNTLQLRSRRTGEPVGAPVRTAPGVDPAVAFSSAGPAVAMHDRAGHAVVLRAWPRNEDDLEQPILRTPKPVRAIAFDQTGLRVITVADDESVAVWTLGDPLPARFDLPRMENISGAWFAADPLAVATLESGAITIWSLRVRGSGMMHLRHDNAGEPPAIRFTPDGDRIVGRSEFQTNVWSRQSGELLGRLTTSEVAVSGAGTHLAHWGPDDTGSHGIDVYDVRDHERVVTIKATGPVRAVALDSSGGRIATVFDDGVHVGDVQDRTGTLRRLGPAPVDVFRIAWLRDAQALLLHAGDRLHVIRASDGTPLAQLPCLSALEWHAPSGSVACGSRGAANWLRVAPDLTVARGDVAMADVDRLAFSDSGAWLTVNGKAQARVVEMSTGRVLTPPSGHRRVLAVHDGTQRAATRSGRTEVSLWNLATGVEVGTTMRHPHDVTCAGFAPSGTVLATGAGPTVQTWDTSVRVGQALGPPRALPMDVHQVTFASDGHTMAASSATGFGTQFYPGYVVLIENLTSVSTDAETLARLAEAVARVRLNDADAVVPHRQADSALRTLARSKDPFLAWYFGDPWTRTLTPGSTLTVVEYLERKLLAGYYDNAEAEFPGHPLFAKFPRSSMVRSFRPLRELPQPESLLSVLRTSEELAGVEVDSVHVATAQLTAEGGPSTIAVAKGELYCGAAACLLPLVVLDGDASGWRVSGEGLCAANDPRLVLTTRRRDGRADFFCGSTEYRWNGAAYAPLARDGLVGR